MGEDISALGLKCGLEIHQQLDTGKLFCRCASVIREDKADFVVHRVLRAAEGETGEVDAAAKMEKAKAKRFQYQGYEDTTCLVELDEEPPSEMNKEALIASAQLVQLVSGTMLDDIHVMRKTVVDGSNTSGFQRTALVALGGKLLEENVRIQTVCLEEDSAKIIERKGDEDIYNLSRLGIPLIEIATEPDITTPEQAQQAAAEIGMLLRSTGKCKRGLGTIRQDVNVSIKGGARVEIKGAQDLRMLPDLVRNEALRQQALLHVKKEMEVRGIKEVLLPSPQDVSKILHKSECKFIAAGVENGVMLALCLPKMDGLLKTKLGNGLTLGKELAGYAKAFGFGGLIHTDEDLSKYPISAAEMGSVRKSVNAGKEDAVIMVLGDHERVKDFFAFSLVPRLEALLHGVPSEVRKALPDGTSQYLRPMPGAARMYPETDVKRVHPPKKIAVVKPLKEQEQALVDKFGLPMNHAKELLRQGWELHSLVEKFKNLDGKFIAATVLDVPKEVKRRTQKELDLSEHEEALHAILQQIDEGKIPRDALFDLFSELAAKGKVNFSQYEAASTAEVEKIVKEVVAADPKAPMGALMGAVMAKLRGRASGKDVMAVLKKLKD